MNRRALYWGIASSIVVIVFKLIILLGGYSLHKFWFYYSNIISILFIFPFYVIAIKQVRDKDYGGIIGGKEAGRIALTVFAVTAVFVSIYNYCEYEYSGKALAIEYYHGDQFTEYLKTKKTIKAEDYPRIIEEQIKMSEGSAFKATTGKLFSLLLIGLSGAFITAVMMKRNTRTA